MRYFPLFTFAIAGMFAVVSAQSLVGQTLLFSESFESPDASGGDIQLATAAIMGINQFGDPSQTNVSASLPGSDGSQTLRIFGPFGGGGTGFNTSRFAATPGESLFAAIDVLTPSADLAPEGSDGQTVLIVDFFDADGNAAGVEAGGQQADNFNRFTAAAGRDFNSELDLFETLGLTTGLAPANTTEAQITLVRLNEGSQGGAQVFDNLRVTTVAAIPEPTSAALLGLGAIVLGCSRRRNFA